MPAQSSTSPTTLLLPHLLHALQVLPGLQSLPLLRLPLMLTPDPVRHWSYEGALIDFWLARHAGTPGDLEGGTPHPGVSSGHCQPTGWLTQAALGSRLIFVAGAAIGQQGSDRVMCVSMRRSLTHCLPWWHTAGCTGRCSAGSSSSRSRTSSLQVPGGVGVGSEDLPGVPAEAWVRVSRGLTPSEPYTQGECVTTRCWQQQTPLQPCRQLCMCSWLQHCTFQSSTGMGFDCSCRTGCCCYPHAGDGMVVVVDGARFLLACTTISRVVGSVWSSSGALLAGPFEGVSQPASEARCPAFSAKALLDAAQAGSSFDDPTATLLLQVSPVRSVVVPHELC